MTKIRKMPLRVKLILELQEEKNTVILLSDKSKIRFKEGKFS